MRPKFTKYVQSAMTIEAEHTTIACDFGSESTPETINSIGKVDATFVSHLHPDHLNVENLKIFDAPIYGPPDVVSVVNIAGLKANILLVGASVTIGSLKITSFRSDHGPNISAPIDNLAFLIESGNRSILFLGDMAVPTALPIVTVDALLVPVGSSKVFSPEEAFSYIQSLNHRGIVIPIHYHGRADREAGLKFKALAGDFCDVRVCEVGESVEI